MAAPLREPLAKLDRRRQLGTQPAARCCHEEVQSDLQLEWCISGCEEVRGVTVNAVQAVETSDGTGQISACEISAHLVTPWVEMQGRCPTLEQQKTEVDIPQRMRLWAQLHLGQILGHEVKAQQQTPVVPTP
ncbi:hypothetical protein AB0C98_29370 [Streptomyces sp. NPDC048558]|uniref:hypothetical protein n=1 Tax=Streptomyces sp. NPDC048558 TaxID=3155759 RepID=UPI003437638C